MTSNREREEVEEGKEKDCIHMYKNKYCTEVNKNFLVLHILVSFYSHNIIHAEIQYKI
jgi:hypothetical protein